MLSRKPNTEKSGTRIVRAPDFGERFTLSCDRHAGCPPIHQGRLSWIVNQFKTQYNAEITVETARRWLCGESKPREGSAVKIAAILGVDMMWLLYGQDPVVEATAKKARNATADGAVNLVAGLISIDGGTPSFPDASDKRAERDGVNLQAIIVGKFYQFHVALGVPEGASQVFQVPAGHSALTVLGVVRRGDGFEFDIYELPDDLITARSETRGAHAEFKVRLPNKAVKAITTFSKLL